MVKSACNQLRKKWLQNYVLTGKWHLFTTYVRRKVDAIQSRKGKKIFVHVERE